MQSIFKISRQTLWQILGKAVTSVSTFIILGTVARNYGEKGTGVFTLALTYLAIFYLLSDFGFNAHVLKKVQSSKFKVQSLDWQKLLGTRILWSMGLILIATFTLLLWPFTSVDFAWAVIFGSLSILGSAVFVSCNLIFQAKLKYNLSVLASGTGTLVSLGVFVYLSLQKYPIPFLMLAHLTGWFVIAAAALFLVKRFLPNLSPIYDMRYTIKLFKDTWPIALTLALNVVYFRIDSFLIAYFKGITDVGIYNVAYSVFQSALVLPAFIMNAYYPLMLKSLSKIKLVGTGLLLLAVFGSLITLMTAQPIIGLLTGEGFLGSVQSLQILSLGFPAYFLSSLLMWFMVTKGRYKTMLLIYTFGLILNLILNFIYIPQYSFLGASWITVVSEYAILLLQFIAIYYFR